jgi:hypothetical protein
MRWRRETEQRPRQISRPSKDSREVIDSMRVLGEAEFGGVVRVRAD